MEPGAETAHGTDIEREEIEEQRTLGLGRERDHASLLAFASTIVDELQVGSLTAKASAVVDDLAADLSRGKVDDAHVRPRTGMRSTSRRPAKAVIAPAVPK